MDGSEDEAAVPSLVVLVRGTNRSPRETHVKLYYRIVSAERSVSDCAGSGAEVGRSVALDAVKRQCSNFEHYPLKH